MLKLKHLSVYDYKISLKITPRLMEDGRSIWCFLRSPLTRILPRRFKRGVFMITLLVWLLVIIVKVHEARKSLQTSEYSCTLNNIWLNLTTYVVNYALNHNLVKGWPKYGQFWPKYGQIGPKLWPNLTILWSTFDQSMVRCIVDYICSQIWPNIFIECVC